MLIGDGVLGMHDSGVVAGQVDIVASECRHQDWNMGVVNKGDGVGIGESRNCLFADGRYREFIMVYVGKASLVEARVLVLVRCVLWNFAKEAEQTQSVETHAVGETDFGTSDRRIGDPAKVTVKRGLGGVVERK